MSGLTSGVYPEGPDTVSLRNVVPKTTPEIALKPQLLNQISETSVLPFESATEHVPASGYKAVRGSATLRAIHVQGPGRIQKVDPPDSACQYSYGVDDRILIGGSIVVACFLPSSACRLNARSEFLDSAPR